MYFTRFKDWLSGGWYDSIPNNSKRMLTDSPSNCIAHSICYLYRKHSKLDDCEIKKHSLNQQINIQFLRSLAALLVVMAHLHPHFYKSGGLLSAVFGFFVQFAYAGVDIFFVISGYVIWISSHSYQGKESSIRFIYNRATRIFLGYWPYLILYFLVLFFLASDKLADVDYVGSIFLTQIGIHKLLIPIAWSLTYEMYFYLCFTFLLLLPRKYLALAIKSLFLLIVLIQGYHILFNDIYAPENFVYLPFYLTFMTSPFCLEFLTGCLLGMYFESGRIKHLKSLGALAVLVFATGFYYQQTYILPTGLLAQGYFLPQRILFWGTTSVLLVAIFIELNKRGVIIMKRTSALLGGASYSIYLSHMPIIFLLKEFGFFTTFQNIAVLQELSVLVVLAIIIGYSVLHYWYIEQPLLKTSKRIWQALNSKRKVNKSESR